MHSIKGREVESYNKSEVPEGSLAISEAPYV